VTLDGRNIELSAIEFRLLHYLASHPGMVFSRDRPATIGDDAVL